MVSALPGGLCRMLTHRVAKITTTAMKKAMQNSLNGYFIMFTYQSLLDYAGPERHVQV
jgi:hypothetical protein